jgi:hypothetical protein
MVGEKGMTHRASKVVLALIMGAVISACAISPAVADDSMEKSSASEAEKVMANFAKCVIGSKKRQEKALAYLMIPNGDPRQNVEGSAIAKSECAMPGSQMRFQGDLFAGTLYTALYRKFYVKTPPGDLSAIEPAVYESEFKVTTTPVGTEQLALRAFGDCAVLQNPAAAHDFAISEMRGQNEKAALPAVVEATGLCVSAGSTLKFSRTILKGVIAESLYKMRNRQAAAAATVATTAPAGAAK